MLIVCGEGEMRMGRDVGSPFIGILEGLQVQSSGSRVNQQMPTNQRSICSVRLSIGASRAEGVSSLAFEDIGNWGQ